MNSERRRVSLVRLAMVVGSLAGVLALGTSWALHVLSASGVEANQTWFAPYVDATLTPTLHWEDPADEPAGKVVLGFIVANQSDPCAPSWGNYYDLEGAARALDLDRRVIRLRERGGEAVVSFGGALNSELATACKAPDALVAAYQKVIDRYHLTAVDFDIEGAALSDSAANARRAAAILRLQQANAGLRVWITLPVAPSGVTGDAVSLIDQLLQSGVNLSGVNVMTMDFGGSRPASMSMEAAVEASLNATRQQLGDAYRRAGAPRTDVELWRLIGATPMIGQNDVPDDVFTPQDARSLTEFAARTNLGRLSFWSGNRDFECGPGVGDQHVSNTCSGVGQTPSEFTRILADATGSGHENAAPAGSTPTTSAPRVDSLERNDPRTNPYPLWRTTKQYDAGAKVAWQGRVYQSKWWSQGDQPDAPVKNTWDTPWRYLGPVLDADREAATLPEPLVDGAQPPWSAGKAYQAGDVVEYSHEVFRAKWWTQGDIPRKDPDQPYDHPWVYLGMSILPGHAP